MQDDSPALWQTLLPDKSNDAHHYDPHKYNYGHAVIYSAPVLTGATRLAAAAASRIGAGLVTVLTNQDNAGVFRTSLPAHIMVRDDFNWDDPRITAKLYGSGGLSAPPVFDANIPIVLDADALIGLPSKLSPHYILTPHEGEFERAFPDLHGGRVDRAMQAAAKINAHVVLKGPATVIAAPDGRCAVNRHASADLATAGTGDVLAGIIAGLAAQHMPLFEACCAAVWIHGDGGLRVGAGLVASDLPDVIPAVLKGLKER